jgi:hypothetical protein
VRPGKPRSAILLKATINGPPPIGGAAVFVKGLLGIALFVVPFLIPWWFITPPRGARFYELVAQLFPVLVIVWAIELRGIASHRAAPTLAIRWLGP